MSNEKDAVPVKRGLFGPKLTRLTPWERNAATVLGALVALHGLLALVGVDDNQKEHSTTTWFLASIVAGAVLIAVARTGRRYPTGLVAVASTFVLPGTGPSLGLAFASLVLGSVIFLRTSNEAARQAGERRRQLREENRAARAAGRPPVRAGRGATPAPTGPKANKRYTPPKPKPKPRKPVPQEKAKKGAKDAAPDDDEV